MRGEAQEVLQGELRFRRLTAVGVGDPVRQRGRADIRDDGERVQRARPPRPAEGAAEEHPVRGDPEEADRNRRRERAAEGLPGRRRKGGQLGRVAAVQAGRDQRRGQRDPPQVKVLLNMLENSIFFITFWNSEWR